MFLRNYWYVAAWNDEVSRVPLARTVLNEDIVLFRKLDGTVVALEDRCAHRRLPLSAGTLVGDSLQCGYHGLVYDCAGKCIKIPGQPHAERHARQGLSRGRARPLRAGLDGRAGRGRPEPHHELPASLGSGLGRHQGPVARQGQLPVDRGQPARPVARRLRAQLDHRQRRRRRGCGGAFHAHAARRCA